MKFLKIILPIGLFLSIVTAVTTHNIARESENLLNNEEMITAALNRQILSNQEARKKIELDRLQTENDDYFKQSIGLK